jgi:hypothetical protein
MDLETRRLLVEGARLVSIGKREEGRKLLLQYLEADENNDEAWLWLSGSLEDSSDIETSLDNCLTINPNNLRALQGIEWVGDYQKRMMPEGSGNG